VTVHDGAAERYLRLALQVGSHVEGIVDAYFGPPALARDVAAAPQVEPSALVADAEALLRELGDGWLRDQVSGLRAYARVLAGEAVPYADEVEACFGVRPTHTDEAVFTTAHERLEELLPGDGPLAERLERWEASIRVPPGEVQRVAAAVIEEARAQTCALFGLPRGEDVELEVVRDEPWLAFCAYQGDLRSRIQINVDLPISGIELIVTTLHETYPGHHAERCTKEDVLVRTRGLLEETVALVPTPQSLVSEGIAKLAPSLLLEGDGGPALAGVLHEAGVELDLVHAVNVQRAREPLELVGVNAALLLHEEGMDEADVRAYVERWELLTPEFAGHVIRFLQEPTSRSYVVTYPAGRELCGAYVAGDPARFRQLLNEQVRVGDLLAAARA
jgi:hypothetical protein